MNAHIYPSTASGSVTIPCSKSEAHRALICAGLSDGESHISNVQFSDDINATLCALEKLGASYSKSNDGVTIHGICDFCQIKDSHIDSQESGSTLRFMIPLFSLCNQSIEFSGSERLLKRPLSLYQAIFSQSNAHFEQLDDRVKISGALKSGNYEIRGDVSSQFISGLLFALPLCSGNSTIKILEPFESKSYVLLTIQMLKRFNITIELCSDNEIFIPGNQNYQACNIEVEGDYSQLAFFAVYAAIHNDLEIKGVNPDSLQGDAQIISILKKFNTKIETLDNGFRIYKSPLKAHIIDLSNAPDLGPILCVLGMYATGKTVITNVHRLRIKESDRILAMESELRKFGVHIESDENNIYIDANPHNRCTAPIDSHQDHRIVMACAVALLCSETEGVINAAHNINKSYPRFFDDVISIKGKVEYHD